MPGTEFAKKRQIVDSDGNALVINADGSLTVKTAGSVAASGADFTDKRQVVDALGRELTINSNGSLNLG